MDLDELLFGRFIKFLKRRRERQAEELGIKVQFSETRPRLTLFARILSGKPIEIFPAEREGGYKDNNYFLPLQVDLFPSFEENLSFYFYRIAYLSIQQELEFNWTTAYSDKQLDVAREKAREAAPFVLERMQQEFPTIHDLYLRLFNTYKKQMENEKGGIDTTWFYGKWMLNAGSEQPGSRQNKVEDKNTPANNLDPTTTIKAKGVEEISSLQVDSKQQEDYVLNHNFEKVETADEFSGVWRDFDGDDQLEDHQDALDEINFRHTVRVDDPVHSVYQAEFIENATVGRKYRFHTRRLLHFLSGMELQEKNL